jgi:hypothetical protein
MWQWMCGFSSLGMSKCLSTVLFWVIMHPIFKDHGFFLQMVPTGCLETSVRNYHYSLSNDPEERSSHLLRGGSLTSWLTGCYEVGKGNNSTVYLFALFIFNITGTVCLTLNTKARRSFKASPASDPTWHPNVTEGLILNFAQSRGQQRYLPYRGTGFFVPCRRQSLSLVTGIVAQRYAHRQDSASGLETDESSDLRLPPRYKSDRFYFWGFYTA